MQQLLYEVIIMTEITNQIVRDNVRNGILRINNKLYTSFSEYINLDNLYLKEIYINNCDLETVNINIFNNSNELTIIDLSHNKKLKNIQNIGQSGLYNGNRVKYINLSYCNLENIESLTFNGLSYLEHINLSHNKFLSKIEHSGFNQCHRLKYINLSNCNFQNIDKNMFQRISLDKLTEINLSYNKKLKYIEDNSFDNFKYLNSINLSNCDLHKIDSSAFSHLDLSRLDLSNNKNLKNIEKGTFNNLKYLEYINISNCNLQIIQSDINCKINLNKNNLIYNCGINRNVNFNNNYLNNEEHPFFTEIRNTLNNNNYYYNNNNNNNNNDDNNNNNNNNDDNNNNNNNSLSNRLLNNHYNYFKNLDNKDLNKINLIINYIYLYKKNKNLYEKNIINIFYIVNILLTKVNIFESDLSLETLIENFIDYFLNFLKYRLNEKIHRLIEKIPKNIKKIINNYYSNNRMFISENFYSNDKIHLIKYFCYSKKFVKCIFNIIKELSKDYNNINISNKIVDIKNFIKTPVSIPKYNINRLPNYLLKENSLMNRLSREELQKQKFNKLIKEFNIESPSMDTKQKIYIYNKIKNLQNTNNLSKEINKIKIDIIKSNKFYDKFKTKNKTIEERKRVKNEIKKFFYFINDVSNKYVNKKEILFLK